MLRPEAVFSGGSASSREKGSLFYLPLMQIILKFGILFVSDTIWLPLNSDDRGHVLVKAMVCLGTCLGATCDKKTFMEANRPTKQSCLR